MYIAGSINYGSDIIGVQNNSKTFTFYTLHKYNQQNNSFVSKRKYLSF